MNKDFRDVLRALSAEDAEFLIVGAYAMAVHGHPRATGDLDIWVHATKENAERVFGALAKFGAPLARLKPADFCENKRASGRPKDLQDLAMLDGAN